jgi:hypothetical protein
MVLCSLQGVLEVIKAAFIECMSVLGRKALTPLSVPIELE